MHVKYSAQYLDIKIAKYYYFSKLYDCWYHLCSNVLHLGLNTDKVGWGMGKLSTQTNGRGENEPIINRTTYYI